MHARGVQAACMWWSVLGASLSNLCVVAWVVLIVAQLHACEAEGAFRHEYQMEGNIKWKGLIKIKIKITWDDLQPDCSADQPVTGPRQSTANP
jgi:hypothetical protein